MKVLSFVTVALLAVTSAQISAAEFTKYVGFIKTKSNPVTLAADPDGNLYYGCSPATLEREVVFIQNPNSKIGNEEAAGTVVENISFASGRIIQGLGVTSDGTKLFMTGDNGGGTNVRRYDITSAPGEDGPVYSWTRNTAFEDTFLNAATGHGPTVRFGGLAIISEAGNGLIALQTFTGVSYCDFNGNKVGTAVTGLPNYHREPVYNSQHNLIYPLRNGDNSAEMIRGYISGIDPVNGGGTWNLSLLVSDGAWNTATAGASQHGFYYAAENQLVTLDTLNTLAAPGSDDSDAKIRVWNTGDDGKTFTLAYSLSPSQDDEVAPNWSTVSDAVITNNRLYVSVSGKTGIYVYEAPGANVDNWSLY